LFSLYAVNMPFFSAFPTVSWRLVLLTICCTHGIIATCFVNRVIAIWVGGNLPQLALETIQTDILNCDYVITSDSKGASAEKKLDPHSDAYDIWHVFTKRIVEQYCWFGFAVFRVVTITEAGDIIGPITSKRRKISRRIKNIVVCHLRGHSSCCRAIKNGTHM
jgi:hypothetical protein